MASVGVRIKQERNRLKLTQAALSAAADVPVSTLRRIENGRVKSSPAITTLCDYLKIPQDEGALVTAQHDPPLSQASFMQCLLRLYELHRQAAGDMADARPPVELSTEPPPVALLGEDDVIKVDPSGRRTNGQTGTADGP